MLLKWATKRWFSKTNIIARTLKKTENWVCLMLSCWHNSHFIFIPNFFISCKIIIRLTSFPPIWSEVISEQIAPKGKWMFGSLMLAVQLWETSLLILRLSVDKSIHFPPLCLNSWKQVSFNDGWCFSDLGYLTFRCTTRVKMVAMILTLSQSAELWRIPRRGGRNWALSLWSFHVNLRFFGLGWDNTLFYIVLLCAYSI